MLTATRRFNEPTNERTSMGIGMCVYFYFFPSVFIRALTVVFFCVFFFLYSSRLFFLFLVYAFSYVYMYIKYFFFWSYNLNLLLVSTAATAFTTALMPYCCCWWFSLCSVCGVVCHTIIITIIHTHKFRVEYLIYISHVYILFTLCSLFANYVIDLYKCVDFRVFRWFSLAFGGFLLIFFFFSFALLFFSSICACIQYFPDLKFIK